PIAVRPVSAAIPGTFSGSGASGTGSISIRSGYTGTLNAAVSGLAAATLNPATFTGTDATFNSSAPAESAGAKKITVTVPAGTAFARVNTYAADVPAGTDVDLYAYDSGGNLVGISGGGTADESIVLAAGDTYSVFAVLFAASSTPLTINLNSF